MAGRKKPAADDKTEESLNAKRELFCWHYAKGEGTFGNATLSYAAAYDIELGDIWLRDKDGNLRPDEKYIGQYAVCSSNGSRLLRNAEVQARIGVLLNELLKDEIVDAELAKVIMQDGKLESKIAAIREYNKLRGRIVDKTQQINRLPFGETDLSTVIATLPQERQDHFYAVITELIAEAELQRSANAAQGSGPR